MYSFSKNVVSYFDEKKNNYIEYGTSSSVIGIITTTETSNGFYSVYYFKLIT